MVNRHNEASPSPRKEDFSIENESNQENADYLCSNLRAITKPTQLGSNKKDVVLLATFLTTRNYYSNGKGVLKGGRWSL